MLRLSRGMTYKAAAAGLNLGGGKAVIIGDPKKDKSEALFRAFGRFVESLGGRYITAEDVGTDMEDMEVDPWRPLGHRRLRRSGGGGDPSPVTALGVLQGIKAAVQLARGHESLDGKRVAVQGVGAVGYHLAQLPDAGAPRSSAPTSTRGERRRRASDCGVEIVSPGRDPTASIATSSRPARSAPSSTTTHPQLRCKIVAGGANNQLADEDGTAGRCTSAGILYAPDYVINAGGLINVYNELEGYNRERRAAHGPRHLRQHAARVRDLPAAVDPDPPGRGPAGRGAHRPGEVARVAELGAHGAVALGGAP